MRCGDVAWRGFNRVLADIPCSELMTEPLSLPRMCARPNLANSPVVPTPAKAMRASGHHQHLSLRTSTVAVGSAEHATPLLPQLPFPLRQGTLVVDTGVYSPSQAALVTLPRDATANIELCCVLARGALRLRELLRQTSRQRRDTPQSQATVQR